MLVIRIQNSSALKNFKRVNNNSTPLIERCFPKILWNLIDLLTKIFMNNVFLIDNRTDFLAYPDIYFDILPGYWNHNIVILKIK